jgi:hypothetical protein
VIVRVPQQAKNLVAGNRCKAECQHYSGVTADFIRWLLAGGQCDVFARRFEELQRRYYGDVEGQQSDIRVATNLALLGAAFELFAEYLGDVWEGWKDAAEKFVGEDLVAVRDGMLGEAKGQQASEVFLRTLADLIRFNHVRIEGLPGQHEADHKPLIGRVVGMRPVPGVRLTATPDQDRLEICTSLALGQVNACLRQQARSELKATEGALIQQLREDGWLLDGSGEALPEGERATRRVRLEGPRQVRVFAVSRSRLLGEDRGFSRADEL